MKSNLLLMIATAALLTSCGGYIQSAVDNEDQNGETRTLNFTYEWAK